MNWSRISTKHLHSIRRAHAKKFEHKRQVAARHKPGTAYHTRASLEAQTYADLIAEIDAELAQR